MNDKQLALSWPAQPSYGKQDFVVGACNRAAHEFVTRWPHWPHFALSLHGPAGAGKTHLARIWQQQADAGLCDPAILAERGPQTMAARRRRWVCELDPALPGMDAQERALFHFHNLIRQAEGSLLLVSRVAASRLPVDLPDLHSRLAACPAVGIERPDDDILRAVIGKLAADRQLKLPDNVIGYIMRHAERSFAGVAAAVAALDETALATGRRIDQKLAADLLPDQGGRGAMDESG